MKSSIVVRRNKVEDTEEEEQNRRPTIMMIDEKENKSKGRQDVTEDEPQLRTKPRKKQKPT
jgi:hypothetical protein